MIKLLANLLLLAVIYLALALGTDWINPTVGWEEPHARLAQRIGFNGFLGLAAGILIIAGGIDLSIGSLVALAAGLLCTLLVDWGWHPAPAIAATLLLGVAIGLFHGLLVTRLRVQAFIVTLCGLFAYRSAARWLTRDSTKNLGSGFESLTAFFNGAVFGVPMYLVLLAVLTVIVGFFLHFTTHGRYLYAIGSNDKAAEYSGIATTRYRILAYVLCSTIAAGYAVLHVMRFNEVSPSSTGSFLELYGIAAAVLGGCSLRGGEGNVVGILLGTCLITILPMYTFAVGAPQTVEGLILAGALLLTAIVDELLRRYYAARKT
jgi:ribose transport system permease protein